MNHRSGTCVIGMYSGSGLLILATSLTTRSYRLALQERWRIHNVFHASLLEPHRGNPFQQRPIARPQPEEVDGELEYEVETLLQSEVRTSRRRHGTRYQNVHTLYFL